MANQARVAPNPGLHILKIEIGGDALSTDGAEPSHMHTETEAPNFGRGYEFWVAKEARERDRRTLLYALPWEWPAWVGEDGGAHTTAAGGVEAPPAPKVRRLPSIFVPGSPHVIINHPSRAP